VTEDIAFAIEDHYKPRFAGDELPRGQVGTVVALADKLETLVGMFGIGNLPTGDKDPFALRRHALGVIRMLVEKKLPLNLADWCSAARRRFGALLPDAARSNEQLLDFIYDRLAGYLREQGYSAQEVDAVLAAAPATPGAKCPSAWTPSAPSPNCLKPPPWPPPTSASATS
jgi:glycyl-tRNA synthetase beta chain